MRHGDFCDSTFKALLRQAALASDARKSEIVEPFRFELPVCSSHLHGISVFQKLFLTLDPNQLRIPRHPVPREGALAIVTDVGAGSDGRGSAFDEQRVTRTAKSCGPDTPMAGVKFLRSSRLSGTTVTSKPWSHRGEHEDKP